MRRAGVHRHGAGATAHTPGGPITARDGRSGRLNRIAPEPRPVHPASFGRSTHLGCSERPAPRHPNAPQPRQPAPACGEGSDQRGDERACGNDQCNEHGKRLGQGIEHESTLKSGRWTNRLTRGRARAQSRPRETGYEPLPPPVEFDAPRALRAAPARRPSHRARRPQSRDRPLGGSSRTDGTPRPTSRAAALNVRWAPASIGSL